MLFLYDYVNYCKKCFKYLFEIMFQTKGLEMVIVKNTPFTNSDTLSTKSGIVNFLAVPDKLEKAKWFKSELVEEI